MINQNTKFKLIASCIPVKGSNRSVICDLQRNNIDLIPNDLYVLLKDYEGKTIEEIKSVYDNEYDNIIDEYFEFLSTKEYIFFTETPELFPKMQMDWYMPEQITNAIVDISTNSDFDLYKIIEELNVLNCKFIELRYFKHIDIDDLKKIISHIDNLESSIVSIDLNFPFKKEYNQDFISNFIKEFPRISSARIYSSTTNEFIKLKNCNNQYIIYSKKIIKNEKFCGIIDSSLFAINIKNFTESKNHNSCLNKKLAIDASGNIKNCPSMPKSFGNIKDASLSEALAHKDFKKYWNITKDQIDVCKDCEFRYICTDCRAYKENPENDYSKPLKCGYNPYTNEWKEWSTNPLKQNAIEYYQMQELIKKND